MWGYKKLGEDAKFISRPTLKGRFFYSLKSWGEM
jgi:hypothetical protein